MLVSKIAGDAENLLESSLLTSEELNKYSENFTEADLIRFFNSLSETETQLRTATQPRYMLEIGLVKLIEMRRVTPLEKILERLAKLESSLSGTALPSEIKPISGQTAERPVNQGNFPAQGTEKKTSIIDFPIEEVPFPIRKETDYNISESFAGKTNGNGSEFHENSAVAEIEQNPVIETVVNEPPSPKPPTGSPISTEFLDSITIKLPPISSEDLEHVDDNWLDSNYEDRLLREGDNLSIIKNAQSIIANVLNVSTQAATAAPAAAPANASNGSTATATIPARAASTIPIFIPSYETEDTDNITIELSENPTEEELLRFAENHPAVKRALKIFRGKIVKVTKN